MADYSQTITNTLTLFGDSPSTKWGAGSPYTMTWGTSKWGEGTEDLPVAVVKGFPETITVTDSLSKATIHVVDVGSLAPTYEGVEETLQDGSGYYYVFPKPTTDSDERNNPSYTSSTAGSQSWTCASVSVLSWS